MLTFDVSWSVMTSRPPAGCGCSVKYSLCHMPGVCVLWQQHKTKYSKSCDIPKGEATQIFISIRHLMAMNGALLFQEHLNTLTHWHIDTLTHWHTEDLQLIVLYVWAYNRLPCGTNVRFTWVVFRITCVYQEPLLWPEHSDIYDAIRGQYTIIYLNLPCYPCSTI